MGPIVLGLYCVLSIKCVGINKYKFKFKLSMFNEHIICLAQLV